MSRSEFVMNNYRVRKLLRLVISPHRTTSIQYVVLVYFILFSIRSSIHPVQIMSLEKWGIISFSLVVTWMTLPPMSLITDNLALYSALHIHCLILSLLTYFLALYPTYTHFLVLLSAYSQISLPCTHPTHTFSCLIFSLLAYFIAIYTLYTHLVWG